MELIAQPFWAELLSHDFMRRAVVAGGCIAVAAGLTGYFVLLRNQVFSADALGHVAFTGGLGAAVAGLPLVGGVFASTIAAALGIESLGGRGRGRDVAIGTVFAWVLGLGALFLSLYTAGRSAAGGTAGVAILFGSILALQAGQATASAIASALTAAAILALARPLLFVSVDPDVAAARGLPTRALGLVFLVVVGATVAEAVQAVGALLVFALMVTPAAAAQRLTARPYAGLLLSAGLALSCLWAGLVLAYYLPYPASFLVTALAFAAYLGAEGLARWRPSDTH